MYSDEDSSTRELERDKTIDKDGFSASFLIISSIWQLIEFGC
jgi:hypothetical protein